MTSASKGKGAVRSGAQRFPRFYRASDAELQDGGASSSEVGGGNGSTSASSRPRKTVAPADDQDRPKIGNDVDDGPGSPTRPRRSRSKPDLFTEYRQENEDLEGSKKKKSASSSSSSTTRFEEKDPYKDEVFWAKMASHPPWPSVKMTESEIALMEKNDSATMAREKARFAGKESVAVTFLGSNNKAIVPLTNLWDYSSKFDDFTRKRMGKQFELGLEKADEIVLRNLAESNNSADCKICDKVVNVPQSIEFASDDEGVLVEAKRSDVLVCDRCLALVHPSCAKENGELINGFDNEREPSWFCADCVRDAPLTLKARKDAEERDKRKRKKSSSGGANGSTSKSGGLAAAAAAGSKSLKSGLNVTIIDGGAGGANSQGTGTNAAKKQKLANGTATPVHHKQPPATGQSSSSSSSSSRAALPRAAERDRSDDFCFVCQDGGTLIICDYPGCERAYHKYCLNNEAQNDDDDMNDDEVWYCPWHFCAECGDAEHPVEVKSASGSRTFGLPPVLASSQLRPVLALKDNDDSVPKIYQQTSASGNGSGTPQSQRTGFIHCVSCPLALCRKHHNVTREVMLGSAAICPEKVDRANRKGFFKCEHCYGPHVRSRNQDRLPSVVLHRFLHRVWSRIVNGHEHMCKLFLCRITPSEVPKNASSVLADLKKRGVTNLLQVRNKIWALEYKSIEGFSSDILLVSRLTAAVFGTGSKVIKQTAESLPLILDHAIKTLLPTIESEHVDHAYIASTGSKTADLAKPFRSGSLFPSVVMKKPDGSSDAGLKSALIAQSEQQWENLLTNIAFKSGQELEHPEQKPARDEAKGIAAALLQAAQSVGGFEDHLPPSRHSLNEMLDQQSLILRSALRSTAFLRDAVQKTFTRFDAGVTNEVDKQDVTLGEMRLAAEYKMVVSSLKAKNQQLQTLIALEREGRRTAETKIKQLEDELKRAK